MGLNFGAVGTPRRSGSLASSMSGLNGLGASHSLPSNGGYQSNGHSSRFFSHGNANAQANGGAVSVAEDDLADMWTAFANLKSEEASRSALKNSLIDKLLNSVACLKQQNSELENLLLAQEQIQTQSIYYDQAELYKRMLERDAFMLVLIDGDGMIFDNDFLRNGEAGGRQAANTLRRCIDKWARTNLQQCPENFGIKARIFVNAKGLADTCRRANIVSSPEVIEDFIRGFTAGDDLFNFIDVGPGKDRADGKMAAEFKAHIYNYQCRHILFGCSHDNGFARLLEKYIDEPDVLTRVTLVEGVPFEKELVALPYNKKRFDNLFRREKIVLNFDFFSNDYRSRQDSKSAFNPTTGVFTPASRTPAPESYSPGYGSPALTRTNSLASSNAISETPVSSMPNASIGGGAAISKWANIARGSAHLPYKDLVRTAPEPKPAGPVIRQNKYGQRIDIEMEYDHDKVFALKKEKYCNQHYIGRGCCHYNSNSGSCPHKHDVKLAKEDLKWLRVVARETVCKKGTACTEIDCIYGHHCPYPKMTEGSLRGTGCINGDKCRFGPEMHGMDKTVAKLIHPDLQ